MQLAIQVCWKVGLHNTSGHIAIKFLHWVYVEYDIYDYDIYDEIIQIARSKKHR